MTDDVLPDPSLLEPGAAALKVQATSKLAFGATTAALVTLASSGTAVLVSHGAASLQAPTALPPTATLTDPAAARGAVVVDRAPGTLGLVETPTGLPPAPPADPTVSALTEALGRRPEPGRRTLTVPLVALPVEAPALPVETPSLPVDVPVVTPAQPVVLPGVVPSAGAGRTPSTPAHGKKATDTRAAEIQAQLKAAEREQKRQKETAHRAKEAEKRAKEAAKHAKDAAKHAAEKAAKHSSTPKAKHSR